MLSFIPCKIHGSVDTGTWSTHGSANKLAPPCVSKLEDVGSHDEGQELHNEVGVDGEWVLGTVGVDVIVDGGKSVFGVNVGVH